MDVSLQVSPENLGFGRAEKPNVAVKSELPVPSPPPMLGSCCASSPQTFLATQRVCLRGERQHVS